MGFHSLLKIPKLGILESSIIILPTFWNSLSVGSWPMMPYNAAYVGSLLGLKQSAYIMNVRHSSLRNNSTVLGWPLEIAEHNISSLPAPRPLPRFLLILRWDFLLSSVLVAKTYNQIFPPTDTMVSLESPSQNTYLFVSVFHTVDLINAPAHDKLLHHSKPLVCVICLSGVVFHNLRGESSQVPEEKA